jgi:Tfp pilus assembly protein FimT
VRVRARPPHGFTAIEFIVVCAVVAVFCGVSVPSAVSVRRSLAADSGARTLALVLREAQARAQASGQRVGVLVDPHGAYEMLEQRTGEWTQVAQGELWAAVSTNYPDGRVDFGASGFPLLAGTATPRAGSFVVGSGARQRTVVVQLAGCVRCR